MFERLRGKARFCALSKIKANLNSKNSFYYKDNFSEYFLVDIKNGDRTKRSPQIISFKKGVIQFDRKYQESRFLSVGKSLHLTLVCSRYRDGIGYRYCGTIPVLLSSFDPRPRWKRWRQARKQKRFEAKFQLVDDEVEVIEKINSYLFSGAFDQTTEIYERNINILDLVSYIYTDNLFGMTNWPEIQVRLNFILKSLTDRGLLKEENEYEYRLQPNVISFLSNRRDEERRHRDSVQLSAKANQLTLFIFLATLLAPFLNTCS